MPMEIWLILGLVSLTTEIDYKLTDLEIDNLIFFTQNKTYMSELRKSVIPFFRYFIDAINSFPASTTVADSKGLDEFDQHICDCLDEIRHVIQLYKEYERLKSTVPKMNEIETELQERIPSLFK